MRELPRARKKKRSPTTPDDVSPRIAIAERTLGEGAARENAAGSGPRSSLGVGVVKSAGSRIEWTQLLRRIGTKPVRGTEPAARLELLEIDRQAR